MDQLLQYISGFVEAPYSALVSNVLLVVLAAIILVAGVLVAWTASHRERLQRIFATWRLRPGVQRAEILLRKSAAFMVRRTHRVGAYGLSFTASLAALVAGIWFFGSAIEDLLRYNGTATFDVPVASFIATHRIAWLTTIMRGIAWLGSDAAACVAALALIAAAYYRHRGGFLSVLLLVSVITAAILDLAMNLIVTRAGPSMALAVGALPSVTGIQPGLTLIGVTFGLIAYTIAPDFRSWRSTIFVWAAAAMVALLVAFSRIYLGTEWLTDVAGRLALALLWLGGTLVTLVVVEQSARKRESVLSTEPALPKVVTSEAPPDLPAIGDMQRPPAALDGLNRTQVAERLQGGQVNVVKEQTSRSVVGILSANLFTRFNGLLGGLFVVILLISGKQDALFGLILIANTAIGVFQELRAKRTLDRLTLLVAPKAHVVRDGVLEEIPTNQIVLDDVLECRPGDQVAVDGILLAADDLEVNESLITGEAEPIRKSAGDAVLSGSFIVAGRGRLQSILIGEQSYARRLAHAARQFSLAESQLRRGTNDILRFVTWALVPTALILFVTQLLYSPTGPHDAAVSSFAAVAM